MKPILENLWNGSIAPGEACGANDPEIENLIALIERHKEKLSRKLAEQQKNTLDKCLDCYEEYTQLITTRAFCDGFSLAAKLLTEALSAP